MYKFIVLVFLACAMCLKLNDPCFHNSENRKGKCIHLQACPMAIKMLYANKVPQTCGFENMKPVVCCPDEELAPPEDSVRLTKKKCNEYSANLKTKMPDNVESHIVGGQNASSGEFPHMASLGYGELPDVHWLCGGSLISERFVLTAAHCASAREHGEVKYVQLGHLTLDGTSGLQRYYKVTKIISHPEYVPPSVYNDIALLELNKPVAFSATIKPACLFTDPDFTKINGYSFQATGWGLTEFGGSYSNVLQKVELHIFDNCKKYYSINKRKMSKGIDYESQFCAGSQTEEKDSCTGDSGGPLQIFYYDRKLYCVVGITSFGKSCGTPDSPGVYTKVSNYLTWLEEIVWP